MISYPVTCPAVYRDENGEIVTSIRNDGSTLSMSIRGVEFHGSDLVGLEPAGQEDDARLSSFRLRDGCLCSCVIETEIPIPLVVDGVTVHERTGRRSVSAGAPQRSS